MNHKIIEDDEEGVPAIYTNADVNDGAFVLPDNITCIKTNAFKNCSDLRNIIIPNTVKSIREYAFSGSGISSVNVPAGITIINSRAFYNCMNFSEINVDTNNTKYSSIDGVLFNKK